MTYLVSGNLALDADFRKRVLIAMVSAAVDIVGETPTGNQENDSRRQSVANGVLNNANAYLDRFVLVVVANPAITNLSLDSDIQFTINSRWDDIAGVVNANG